MKQVKNKTIVAFMLAAAFGATLNAVAQKAGFNMTAPQSPDPKITPGDALPVTAKDICVSGYTKLVRNVPQAVKEQAYKNYGISHREKGEYEVDHLISLELGGSNSIKNLWPESFQTKPWNAHVKDQLENELHREICAGEIDISNAQKEIATDWIASYKKHFHTNVPLADSVASRMFGGGRHSSGGGKNGRNRRQTSMQSGGIGAGSASGSVSSAPSATAPSASAPAGQVWVNTKSGAYWKPGTRYFGKTKQGKYMSEADAVKAGYHAAGGQ